MHDAASTGSNVIAKATSEVEGAVERMAYEELLPLLSVGHPRYLGWCPRAERRGIWLFVEEAIGSRLSGADDDDRAAAARWVGTLHAQTWGGRPTVRLPVRDAARYRAWCETTLQRLRGAHKSQFLASAHVALLQRIAGQLEQVLARWSRVNAAFAATPLAAVHGDFAPKNVIVRSRSREPDLVVFDWAEAHWGPVATDLFGIDRDVYGTTLRRAGVRISEPSLERYQELGRLLRTIIALRWEIERVGAFLENRPEEALGPENVTRPMRRMEIYHNDLRSFVASQQGIGT